MRKSLVAVWLGLCATPALAQQAGTIELGGFLRFNSYDKSYNTSEPGANQWGGGGRLGLFFSRRWALEADASANPTDVKDYFVGLQSTALTYYPVHLRLLFNHRFGDNGPFSWFVGAGPGYNRYGKRVAGEPGFRGSDIAAGGITGFRAMLTSWLAFRVDGTFDYIWNPNNGKPAIVNQAAGITASKAPSSNTMLGAQAGLSLLLRNCNRSRDGTSLSPASAALRPGETAAFTAVATTCGHPDQAVMTVSGPGTVSPGGVYTASTAGTATVTACGQHNQLCSSARITVSRPAPPPAAPVRTLVRCELAPASGTARIDQLVDFMVTCFYSDNTSESGVNFTLSSPGGAVAGKAISWATPGIKTITASIPGGPTLTFTARVEVQQIHLVLRDSANFQVDKTVIYRGDDQTRLKEIAKILIEHPEIKLSIDGHTDADATVKYNERLGLRRAVALKSFLAEAGVPVDRMTIALRTFGECVPVAPNATAGGRGMNRRVELQEFGNTAPGAGSAACREAGRERKP